MTTHYSRSYFKDNSAVIAGNLLVYLKGLILMPIIIKTVGVGIYGGFVLLLSLWGFVYGIASFGVGVTAKRYLPSAHDVSSKQNLFFPQLWFCLLSTIIISILLIIFDQPIKTHLFRGDVHYSVWLVPLFTMSYLLYAQGSDYFRYTRRVHFMSVAGIAFVYSHILFILLFFYFASYINLNILVGLQILSALIIAAVCFKTIVKELGVRFIFFKKKELFGEVRLGFPLVFDFILDFILSGTQRYFIAFFIGVMAVGYYNPGYVLGSIVIFIPKAMSGVLPQLMSRAIDNQDEAAAHNMLNYSLKYFLLLAIPFIFGSMILDKPLLTLLGNHDVAERARFVTPIVAVGTLFYGLNLILSNALFVRLRTVAMLKVNILAGLFNTLANLVLLYYFRNILVAAFTIALSYFIVFIYVRHVVRKDWQIQFQMKNIVKSLLASLGMLFFLMTVSHYVGHQNSLMVLCVELFGGVGIYVLAILGLKVFSTKEIQLLRNILSK